MALREPPSAQTMLLPDTFAGRSAIITGGGSGLGLETALALARCGADVALVGRSLEKTTMAAAEIARETGVRAVGVSADVRHSDQVTAAFDAAEGAIGIASILVNNAGANFPAPSESISANGFGAVVRIALDGTFLCSGEFYRRYVASDHPCASILNNGAQYQFDGLPGAAASTSAKAAVASLTKTLAAEWAVDGIRVNSLVAGFFPHEGSLTAKTPEEADEKVGRRIAAGRTGRMRELGWLAAYLCSPYASFITGVNLFIDGGESLRRRPAGFAFTPPKERVTLWS